MSHVMNAEPTLREAAHRLGSREVLAEGLLAIPAAVLLREAPNRRAESARLEFTERVSASRRDRDEDGFVGDLTLHGRVDPVNAADVRAQLAMAIEIQTITLDVLKQFEYVMSGEDSVRGRRAKGSATDLIKQLTSLARKTRDRSKVVAAAKAVADSD